MKQLWQPGKTDFSFNHFPSSILPKPSPIPRCVSLFWQTWTKNPSLGMKISPLIDQRFEVQQVIIWWNGAAKENRHHHNEVRRAQSDHSPHKRKSTALSRKSVAGDVNIAHLPAPLEHAPQVFRRGAVREVVYFQGHHAIDAGWRSAVTHFDAEPLILATTRDIYSLGIVWQVSSLNQQLRRRGTRT